MAKQVITLHMYEYISGARAGERTVQAFDFRPFPESLQDRIWIGCQDVDLHWPDIDTRQMQIDALENQVKQERVDSQVRVNLLMERISKLQAIGHDGGDV